MKSSLMLYFCLLFTFSISSSTLWGQNFEQIQTDSVQKNTSFIQSKLKYQPKRDKKRLLINTAVNMGINLTKFVILWTSPECFSNWDKRAIRNKGYFESWKEHVKEGPKTDKDSFFLNGIMHPWGGAIYYMSARGCGFRWWESFLYSAVLSTFMWEYGIEAIAEVPSWQDLTITPIVGSVIGECFFLLKGKIVENDRRVLNSRFLGTISLLLIDPVNEISNIFGYSTKHKMQMTSSVVPALSHDNKSYMGFKLQIVCRF